MNSSSARRSLNRTPSSSPRTLRRLQSTPRQVHFANSNNKKKGSRGKNSTTNSQHEQEQQEQQQEQEQYQQPSTTEMEELETIADSHVNEMTPSNMINLISLSDQETTDATSNQINTSCKSPSISSSEAEIGNSTNADELLTMNPTKQALMKKSEVLAFFDESEDRSSYKCKTCQVVRVVSLVILQRQL